MNYRKTIENILKNGARTTKWDVIVPDMSGSKEQKMSLLAKDVSLPALGTKTVILKYKGRDIPVAGQVKHANDFSVTFMVDQEHSVRKYFEDWILMFDARGYQSSFVDSRYEGTLRSKISGESSLYRNITIMQYPFDAEISPTSNEKPSAQYTLYGCFPTNIGEFAYNNDNESILDLRVQFSCCYYQRDL